MRAFILRNIDSVVEKVLRTKIIYPSVAQNKGDEMTHPAMGIHKRNGQAVTRG
jgi:hypothetical protein